MPAAINRACPSRAASIHTSSYFQAQLLHQTTIRAPPSDAISLSEDDRDFLVELVRLQGKDTSVHGTSAHSAVDASYRVYPRPPFKPDYGHGDGEPIDGSCRLSLMEKFSVPLKHGLTALQTQDSHRLLALFQHVEIMDTDDIIEAVRLLPRPTFSELLRSVDPLKIAPDHESIHGMRISPGMWQAMNLEHIIDKWGVRKQHTRTLNNLIRWIAALRRNLGSLTTNDYVPLFRAAGAAGDLVTAKSLWHTMDELNLSHWRQDETYNELLKARLVIEPECYAHDKTRIVMSARNIQRLSKMQHSASLQKLDRLRYNTRKKSFYFGLYKGAEHVEDLSRVLKLRAPINRLFYYTLLRGYEANEDTLCTFIVAFGRAGALRDMQSHILEDCFGIRVTAESEQQRNTVVEFIWPRRRRPGNRFRPQQPNLRPSKQFMGVVLEAYFVNGQLETAFKVIKFISTEFSIPIDQHIWFELMEWAHVLSCPPVSTGWRLAGKDDRFPNVQVPETLWNAMKAPPYHAKPGFRQTDILIQSLIARSQFHRAFKLMRIVRSRIYKRQCAAYELTVFEHIRVVRTGVDSASSLRTIKRARAVKRYMWYRIQLWCRSFFNRFRTLLLYDERTNCTIPHVVREWREFLPNPVQYRTGTGYVQLVDPAAERPELWVRRDHILYVPIRKDGRVELHRLRKRERTGGSRQLLVDFLSPNLNPMSQLIGRSSTFLTP
ncbi:hypothetical protein BX600DRAFT_470611 [Xylariales sp. PMI_506]|nr:hypothetical protein BX600DRAFT_470611 [Xylariales sp. PMI_506]